jgi:hypothetical protein
MQTIDNFIGTRDRDEIASVIASNDFPWYMNDNQSNVGEPRSVDLGDYRASVTDRPYGFSHTAFWHEGSLTSPFYPLFEPILDSIASLVQCDIGLIRLRAALTTNVGGAVISYPHVDHLAIPHKTLLYYPMDSSAPTVLFMERHDPNVVPPIDFHLNEVVVPTAGSAMLFDGWTYHSSSYPVEESKRIVVNVNFIEVT